MRTLLATLVAALLLAACGPQPTTLLNVSYDPTREFYVEFNAAFETYWKEKTGKPIKVNMSHDGSAKQAGLVINGLQADVVTLALDVDVDAIAAKGKIAAGWKDRLPQGAAPYTSTIVFVVRQGNPKGIRDWADLERTDVGVIQPDPRTSGGARWNYLAMWSWANEAFSGDEAKTRDYVAKVYKQSPKLDAGARGSTLSFAKNRLGDVLVTWENEAILAQQQYAGDHFEIVYPSMSILAQPPVALVDQNADKHKLRDVAEEYLKFLYTKDGQRIAAKHYFRPVYPDMVDSADLARFREIRLVKIDAFGGWAAAQAKHFAANGTFDQIYKSK